MEPGVRHGIRPGTKYKGGKTTDLVEQVCFCVAKRGPLPVEHPAFVTQGHDAPETMHLKRLVGYEVHLCVGRAAHQSRGDFLVGDNVDGRITFMFTPWIPTRAIHSLSHGKTRSAGRYIFDKLRVGGRVTMAPQDTFWGARFAMLTDRYGTGWMLSCDLKQS